MNSLTKKITAFSFLILFALSGVLVSAQEATESAPEATSAANRLREEIEEIVKNEELTQKKGYVGEIVDIFNRTVVIETTEGKKTARVDEEATIIDIDRKSIDFEDLEIGSWVILMGFEDTTEKLTAKRIVETAKKKRTPKEAFVGEIIEAEQEKLVIKTAGTNEPAIVLYDEATEISPASGEMETGTKIAAVGIVINETKISANAIRILSDPEPTPEPELVEED